MENNNSPRKIEGAYNPKLKQKQRQTQNLNLNQNVFYSKAYYKMFFTIMILTFVVAFWLCNFTKLKEMFQTIALSALAIAIAEYFTRNYFKNNLKK